jgi:putative ABC transport system permease protein
MLGQLVYLARVVRRSPSSAVAALLTLAVTLGAGASILAVVDAVLLTPPPFTDPDSLVTLGETPLDESGGAPRAIDYLTLEAWRDRARSLVVIEASDPTFLTLTGMGAAERTRATNVTAGFLSLLGATPMMGRVFNDDDVGQPVAIVSHTFWRGKLGADAHAIGRAIVLGGLTHTIVGVLPARFSFGPEIWRPLPLTPAQAARTGVRVQAIARLAPNVTPASLTAALDDVSRTSAPPARVVAARVAEAFAGGSARTLGLLAGAAALATLIAFINLAGLLMVRSIDRGRELALRTALGASRMDIAKQPLVEALAIAAAGTITGAWLAFWVTPEVARLALQQFGGVGSREIAVSWRVIVAVSILAAACACVCGAIPAILASHRNVADVLRRGATASPRERWFRRAFATAVVSVAFVLIVSVTLLGRSLFSVLAIDPGFSPDGVVTAAVALAPAKYPNDDRIVSFYSTLESELSSRLGAGAFGIIDELPLTHDRGRRLVAAQKSDPRREAVIRSASTGYFDVMHIPVLAGRTFERRDDAFAPTRVVIGESLAAQMFPGESPVGRQLVLGTQNQPAEIIGIVGDVRHRSLDEPILPTVYVSAWQFPSRGSRLVLRSTRADAMAIVVDEVRRLDGDLPVYDRVPMTDVIAASPGVPVRRVLVAAFLGFALLAVLLGAIGLFGVVAHDVASRRMELALRIALGANPTRILTTTLAQGAWMVGPAIVLGGVLSFWASRAIAAVISTSVSIDLMNAGAAAAVLILVGACAVLPAARRAARIDPLAALRGEG